MERVESSAQEGRAINLEISRIQCYLFKAIPDRVKRSVPFLGRGKFNKRARKVFHVYFHSLKDYIHSNELNWFDEGKQPGPFAPISENIEK